MRRLLLIHACLWLVGFSSIYAENDPYASWFPAGDVQKRNAILQQLKARLPALDTFDTWVKNTGELPPDFDLFKSSFILPDPLTRFSDEQKVTTKAGWAARRAEILKLTEFWLVGEAPPAPGNVIADSIVKKDSIWNVRLSFGPNHVAHLHVALYLPPNTNIRSPIFVCDGTRYLSWVEKARKNGFGVAVHNAHDGSSDESLKYVKSFGDYDWFALRRRGWSASRVVDWLNTLSFVDTNNIYVGGHSRAGKAALITAAFDTRFAGVIASSPGSGGSLPYRYCDQTYFGECIESLTRSFRDWVHLRTRFFSGNEDKLPADNHFLYALVAPRPVLMATASEDQVENTWALEQVYKTVQPVYELLGAPTNLIQRYRPGNHDIVDDQTPIAYSDFLLAAVKKDKPLPEVIPFTPLHPWDYQAWATRNPINVNSYPEVTATTFVDASGNPYTSATWKEKRQSIVSNIQWLIGNEIPYAPKSVKLNDNSFDATVTYHFDKIATYIETYAKAEKITPVPQITTTHITFGDGIKGCLYMPAEDKNLPLVIWLGPLEPAQGYVASFYNIGVAPPAMLLCKGFPVFSYDHIGTFLRKDERSTFFVDNPDASLMGKMVCDARHAIDAALAGLKTQRPIFMYGYAMGGMVALLTAGVDGRVAAVASVAGFTPLRTDTPDKRTGGLARLSRIYEWLPRVGAFIGNEKRLPIDFNEILASVAPRKALIVAPTLDRYATHSEVLSAVAYAKEAYTLNAVPNGITVQEPADENLLTNSIQEDVVKWLLQWKDVAPSAVIKPNTVIVPSFTMSLNGGRLSIHQQQSGEMNLSIVDVRGRTAAVYHLRGEKASVSVKNMAAGMYIVHYKTVNQEKSAPLLID